MVKHVALIIGCVILSFSADLIVPTSCSPIGENKQKETNLAATRSKRSTSVATTGSSASSSSSAQSQIIEYLSNMQAHAPARAPAPAPAFSLGSSSNGLAGLLKSLPPNLLQLLSPLFGTLGGTVANIDGTLGTTLDKFGTGLSFINGPLNGLQNTLEGLLGKPGYFKPSYESLTPYLSYTPMGALIKTITQSDASAAAQAGTKTVGLG